MLIFILHPFTMRLALMLICLHSFFSVSRVSGWLAHIFEQYRDNRLIRPRAIYVGPEDRKFLPIEERI